MSEPRDGGTGPHDAPSSWNEYVTWLDGHLTSAEEADGPLWAYQAAREILAEHAPVGDVCGRCIERTGNPDEPFLPVPAPCRTVLLLGLPYQAFDDYDERWRP